MIRMALTNLRSASGRLVAAGIAIAVSVSFIVAALLFSSAFGDTLANQVRQEWAGADVAVQQSQDPEDADTPEDAGVELTPELRDALADVDGVQNAELELTGFLFAEAHHSSIAAEATGFPDTSADQLTAGTPPRDGTEVVLRENDASALGLEVGETLSLTSAYSETGEDEDLTVTVSGLLPGGSGGLTAVYLSDAGLADAPTELSPTLIRIAGETGTDPAALAGDVQAALDTAGADSLTALTAEQMVENELEDLSGAANMLSTVGLAFGLLSTGVAALVISNTFQVLVASRTRTLALYRAVGASRSQVRGATLLEGLLLGIAGAVAGLLLGLALGWGLTAAARAFWMPEFAAPALTPAALLVGPLLGIGVTVLAGLVPAQRATRVSPIEALRPSDVRPAAARFPWVRASVALVLGLAGLAGCLAGALLHDLPTAVNVTAGIVGCFILFTAVLIGARAFVPPLIGTLAAALAALTGRSKTVLLAGRSAREAGGRTASTTAALMIGITLVSAVVIGAASLQRTIELSTAEDTPADLVIDGAGSAVEDALAEAGVVTATAVVPAVRAEVASAGEDSAEAVSGDAGSFAGELTVTTANPSVQDSSAQDPSAQESASGASGTRGVGSTDDVLRSEGYRVETGTVLLSPADLGVSADSSGLTGETVTIRAGETALELTLEASTHAPAGTALVSGDDASTLLEAATEDQRSAQTWVQLDDRASIAQVQALTSQLEAQDVTVDPGAALTRAQFAQTFQVAIAVVLGLLAAAVVIAVIGVSNTLTLAVIDRRREGALLRALGFSRGSLGRMITIESLLMTVVALAIGLALGTLFAWTGSNALIGEITAPELSIPWSQMGLISLAAIAAAAAASAIPARSMSRIPPAEGMSQE